MGGGAKIINQTSNFVKNITECAEQSCIIQAVYGLERRPEMQVGRGGEFQRVGAERPIANRGFCIGPAFFFRAEKSHRYFFSSLKRYP
jgi:hypothetical protein